MSSSAASRHPAVRPILSAVVLLVGLGGAPLSALQAPADIGEARAAAKQSADTPEGGRFREEVLAAFGRDHAQDFQGCAALLRNSLDPATGQPAREELSDFVLVVRVGAGGEVDQALVHPATTVAACVRGRLRGWKPGAPPRPGTWVEIQVVLDVDDWLSPDYVDLARRYASGERASADAAVILAMQWPDERLRREARVLQKLGRRAAACSAGPQSDLRCGQIGRWTMAALMVHTEAARQLYEMRQSPKQHLAAALAVTGLMRHDAALRAFLGRFFLAMAADAEERSELSDALYWAGLGVKEFPELVDLRLVVASVEELLASLAPSRVPDWAFSEPDAPRLRGHLLATGRGRRVHLQNARSALLEVLRLRPERHDARVRLGRVEWRLGNASESRQAFETVLAGSPSSADAYLAQLFLGRIEEDQGRLSQAEVAYAVAVTLDPESQAARLALSNVELKRGDTAAARRSVEQALAAAGRRKGDAFWLYPWGPSRGSAALLSALRRDASS